MVESSRGKVRRATARIFSPVTTSLKRGLSLSKIPTDERWQGLTPSSTPVQPLERHDTLGSDHSYLTPFSMGSELRAMQSVFDALADDSSDSDTEVIHTQQSTRCKEVLRATHLQRRVLTRYVHAKLRSQRKGRLAPKSPFDLLLNSLAPMLRVMSFLDGGTLVRQVFPTCKAMFALRYSETLWRMAYVCGSPLMYTSRIHPVAELLFTPLSGTGFDVNVLEDRSRFYDLFVAMHVCGYHRVMDHMEVRRKWWGDAFLVSTPQQAFSFCVGYEVAGRVDLLRRRRRRGGEGGAAGSRRGSVCSTPRTSALTSPSTASLMSSTFTSSACGTPTTFAEVATQLWRAVFQGKVTEFTPASNCLRGKCCSHANCHTVHFPDAALFKAVLYGAVERLGLHPVKFDVKFLGCEARVRWYSAGDAMAQDSDKVKAGSRAFELKPNLLYFTKSVSLLDTLLDENAAGPRWVDEHIAVLLNGSQSALRTTPAERKMVQCRHCLETISSFDFAACHSRGRCVQGSACATEMGTSTPTFSSSPSLPASPSPAPSPNTGALQRQQQYEAELRLSRLSLMVSQNIPQPGGAPGARRVRVLRCIAES